MKESLDGNDHEGGQTMNDYQMDLFRSRAGLNVITALKREIRLSLSTSNLSREQIADRMYELARRDNVAGNFSKQALDNWVCGLLLFCEVMRTTAPLQVVAQALGAQVIDAREAAALSWAKAEIERRRAAKRARLAQEMNYDEALG